MPEYESVYLTKCTISILVYLITFPGIIAIIFINILFQYYVLLNSDIDFTWIRILAKHIFFNKD